MKKVLIGAVLGGLVLFVWSAIAHMVPLGTAGERVLTPAQEDVVLGAMRGAMSERALYILPGFDTKKKTTPEEQSTWLAKFAAGPAAVVAFYPHPGDRATTGALFGTIYATELLCSLLAALLAAVLMIHLPSGLGFLKRALLVGSVGLLMTLEVDASYWNWFGFPLSYTLGQLFDHGIGWCLAGMVLARVCRE